MKNKYLFVVILMTQSLGCMKDTDKKVEYGPEVPIDLVVKVMKTAIGSTDTPEQILNGEFTDIVTTREIRGQPEIAVLSQIALTVVDRKESTNQWQVKNTEQIQYYNLENPKNNPPLIIREDHQCWNKSSLNMENCEINVLAQKQLSHPIQKQSSQEYKESINDLMNTKRHFNFSFEDQIVPFKQMQTSVCVTDPENPDSICTYHNVSSKKMKIAPPQAVQQSANCANIPNCQINVTVVEFDEVHWEFSVDGYKLHYKFVISPDVPQLSRRLQICKQGSVLVPISNKPLEEAPRFLVTFCDTVANFIPGSL